MPWFGLQRVLWYFLIIFTYFFVFDQALHQEARLDNLVQLFNAEGHAIGIKPVPGIDNAIAKYVLTNLSKKWICILTQNDSYNFHAIILLC